MSTFSLNQTPYPPRVGTDPELFIVEKKNPKVGIPSEFFLPADKDVLQDPWISTRVKVDNGAIEINPSSATCLQGLNGQIS